MGRGLPNPKGVWQTNAYVSWSMFVRKKCMQEKFWILLKPSLSSNGSNLNFCSSSLALTWPQPLVQLAEKDFKWKRSSIRRRFQRWNWKLGNWNWNGLVTSRIRWRWANWPWPSPSTFSASPHFCNGNWCIHAGWLLHRLWAPRQHLQRLHHPVKYARELIRVKRGRDLT